VQLVNNASLLIWIHVATFLHHIHTFTFTEGMNFYDNFLAGKIPTELGLLRNTPSDPRMGKF